VFIERAEVPSHLESLMLGEKERGGVSLKKRIYLGGSWRRGLTISSEDHKSTKKVEQSIPQEKGI